MKIKNFCAKARIPLLIALFVGMRLAVSCQVNRDQRNQDIEGGVGNNDPLALGPPMAPSIALFDGSIPVIKLFRGNGTSNLKIAELEAPPCENATQGPLDLHLRTQLHSQVGWHTIDLTLEGQGSITFSEISAPDRVHAEVDGFRMSFPGMSPLASMLRARSCIALDTNREDLQMTMDRVFSDQLGAWLKIIAPDCQTIELQSSGWDCQSKVVNPLKAKQELLTMQSTMVHKWSRQPYLYARRVAIGLELANALANNTNDQALDIFCRIMSTAVPGELPITLASRRWQDAACELQAKNRRTSAMYGLTKTVLELEFLSQLFENTSRLGLLTLRIPGSQAPSRQIMLSLTPEVNVADNLTRETTKIGQNDDDEPLPKSPIGNVCWHPIYGESPRLLKLAKRLGIIGESNRATCDESIAVDKVAPPTMRSIDRYIAESITSESEFILPNGRSKTLRLPMGSYTYTLRAMPDDTENWDDASQQQPTASGLIEWDNKRPKVVISKW